ncbi:hypothetical protein IW262DRAFT_1302754 [Armillaria fumosa]|nr:hypothetical protein IW262DRAFT_1302754 [Armillaria fumosa]
MIAGRDNGHYGIADTTGIALEKDITLKNHERSSINLETPELIYLVIILAISVQLLSTSLELEVVRDVGIFIVYMVSRLEMEVMMVVGDIVLNSSEVMVMDGGREDIKVMINVKDVVEGTTDLHMEVVEMVEELMVLPVALGKWEEVELADISQVLGA